MKVISLSAAIVSVSVLLLSSAPMLTAAAEHQHHHEMPTLALSLDQGEKWPIDNNLHTGMTKIKVIVSADLADIHDNKLTIKKYKTLANELEQALTFIFKNCALPENADAQLHLLLIPMLQGVEQMKGQVEQRNGAIKIMQALQRYPVYFNDLNWQ